MSKDLKYINGRPPIYVAGPMTTPVPGEGMYRNIGIAAELGTNLWHKGWLPFIPHLNSLWEMVDGALDKESDDGAKGWLEYDFAWVSKCAALVRIPGVSPGGDREVALAKALGILVLTPKEALEGPERWLWSSGRVTGRRELPL